MAGKCTKSDIFPVRTCQRVCLGRARLGSFDQLGYEVSDWPVPVVVTSLHEERVEKQKLADTPNAVDRII